MIMTIKNLILEKFNQLNIYIPNWIEFMVFMITFK